MLFATSQQVLSASAFVACVIPTADGAQGVIIAQGGWFGGWSLYLTDGRPAYCYNLFGIQRFKIHADTAVQAGEHQVRAEFDYDGGGLAKGGTLTLYVDGQPFFDLLKRLMARRRAAA